MRHQLFAKSKFCRYRATCHYRWLPSCWPDTYTQQSSWPRSARPACGTQFAVLALELFPEASFFLLSWNCLFQHWERMSLSTMGEGSAAGTVGCIHPSFWTSTLHTGVSLIQEWHQTDNSRWPRPNLWLKQSRDMGSSLSGRALLVLTWQMRSGPEPPLRLGL